MQGSESDASTLRGGAAADCSYEESGQKPIDDGVRPSVVRVGAVGYEPAACEREVALSAVASCGLRLSRALSFGCDLQSSRSG